jgi:hypothetical protein
MPRQRGMLDAPQPVAVSGKSRRGGGNVEWRLCGKVRFEIDGKLGETRLCYCTLCRRANGCAFSANVAISVERYRLSGREHVREYESSCGAFRPFCSHCGSPVYGRVLSDPDHIRIRLGALEKEADAKVVAHV